ncbi:MAG: TIR domain-containing protein [Cyanobacteriota bacterium]
MSQTPRLKGLIAGQQLPIQEWKLLERVLKMGGGYVLNFSDKSFANFFAAYGVDIDDRSRFFESGTSKANRLRTFLRIEEPPLVGQVLLALLYHGVATRFEGRDIADDYEVDEGEIRRFRAIAERFTVGFTALGRSIRRFRVALSFAGEKRQFVDQVARILARRFGEDKILYDKFHEAEFARSDLGIYLPDLYNANSDLVVVIVCPDYDAKQWTGLEWAAIYDLLSQRKTSDVMLCRFKRSTVKGIYSTAGFVELDDKSPEQVVTLVLQRLALNEGFARQYYF